MVKNRIVTQITQKTGMAKSKNADNTLADLRAKYHIFAKNLKFLITSLTANHACMVGYSKARLEVAKAINSLTVDTPLFGCAGDIPANNASVGTVDGGGATASDNNNNNNNSSTTDLVIANNGNTNTNSKDSYAAIHLALHRKNKLYHDKYTEHILTYAAEWERVLTTRINGHLKQSETLRVDLDHYAKKVEDLHKTINRTMTKGKPVSDDNVDRLKRNEAKLIQARMEYDRFVNDLCGYMEEVMSRGWKDLHPLLVKMAQFDATLCNEESSLFARGMTGVTDRLKNMKNDHPGLTPLGRLKELETASLESIARSNPDYGVIVQGGGEAATFAPLGGSSTTTIGGGGLFSTLVTSSSDELPLNSDHKSDAGGGGGGGGGGLYGQTASAPSSGNYDWTRGSGGEGGGGGNFIAPAPSSGSGYDWATGGGVMGGGGGGGVSSIAPSEMVDRRRTGVYSNNPTSPQMSSMLMAMQHAPPPPTLGDIYDLNNGGTSSNAPPAPPAQQQQQQYYGARPPMPPAPPPSMPPPPPPTPTNNNMMTSNFSQMSMYGSLQGGGSGSSTNPFGDDSSQVSYGAPPQQGYGVPQQQQQGYGAAPPPSYGAPPQQGYGAPTQQGYGAPTQQAPYGQQQQQATYGTPRNPF